MALCQRLKDLENATTARKVRENHLFVGVSGRRACFCDRYWPLGGHQDDQRQRPTEFAISVSGFKIHTPVSGKGSYRRAVRG
jgi:hypothetical protein